MQPMGQPYPMGPQNVQYAIPIQGYLPPVNAQNVQYAQPSFSVQVLPPGNQYMVRDSSSPLPPQTGKCWNNKQSRWSFDIKVIHVKNIILTFLELMILLNNLYESQANLLNVIWHYPTFTIGRTLCCLHLYIVPKRFEHLTSINRGLTNALTSVNMGSGFKDILCSNLILENIDNCYIVSL
jgi:hypothetical protein